MTEKEEKEVIPVEKEGYEDSAEEAEALAAELEEAMKITGLREEVRAAYSESEESVKKRKEALADAMREAANLISGNQIPLGQVQADGTVGSYDKEHKFWNTQPMPKMTEQVVQDGPLEVKTVEEVKTTPYALPAGFEWTTIDVNNEAHLQELYDLLLNNYVEDNDHTFRFAYPKEFLKWALTPPGYYPEWMVGVRVTSTGRIVGSITGVPTHMSVNDNVIKMCEINFLCVDKKLRAKRLAPVLIKEVTRRVNLCNIWQAAYTAGSLVPKPVSTTRYWHRSLNPRKLVNIGFSGLPNGWTMARLEKHYKLPAEGRGLVPMESRHVKSAYSIWVNFMKKYPLHPAWTEEEFAHFLLPREGVVGCVVLPESEGSDKVTDFVSYYHIPTAVMSNPRYKDLHAAYLFYYVYDRLSLNDLIGECLIYARDSGMDVVNCLNLMDNESFVKELLFGIGDGDLHYYLYNWATAQMKPNQIGLVLQ